MYMKPTDSSQKIPEAVLFRSAGSGWRSKPLRLSLSHTDDVKLCGCSAVSCLFSALLICGDDKNESCCTLSDAALRRQDLCDSLRLQKGWEQKKKKKKPRRRSRCWSPGPLGWPLSPVFSTPYNMHAAHSRPIAEAPAALRHRHHGNLVFLPPHLSESFLRGCRLQSGWYADTMKGRESSTETVT